MSDDNLPRLTDDASDQPDPAAVTWSVTCSGIGGVGQSGLTFGEIESSAPWESDRAITGDDCFGTDQNPAAQIPENLELADYSGGESDTDSVTVSGNGSSDEPPPNEQGAAAGVERAGQPSHSIIMARHKFVCRLTGSETRRVVQALPMKMPANAVAMVTGMRAFFARGGVPDVTCPVAGLEIGVELVDNALACTVRLSDFNAGESVVVEVDAAAYGVH